MEDGPKAPALALLARARDIAADILAPRANRTDQARQLPAPNIRCLAEAGLLGLTVPVRYGGQGAPRAVAGACLETLATACGVTTFVASRHLLACRQIAASKNERLKSVLLPELASGRRLCARGTTHLLRNGPPVLQVSADGDDFIFDGTAPWVTGLGLMHDVLLGGTLPDGSFLRVVVPFADSAALQASKPMRLCAMSASVTVALECHGLRVAPEQVLGRASREDLLWRAAQGLLDRTMGPLAVTGASLSLIRQLAETRASVPIAHTADALQQELAGLRDEVQVWRQRFGMEGYWANAHRIVGWAHELSVRAAHSAVTAAGAAANSLDHTAQRLYREAMFYTIYFQTAAVQTAILERLTASSTRTVESEIGVYDRTSLADWSEPHAQSARGCN